MASRTVPLPNSTEKKNKSSHLTSKVSSLNAPIQILRKDSNDLKRNEEKDSKPKPLELVLPSDTIKTSKIDNRARLSKESKAGRGVRLPPSNETSTIRSCFKLHVCDFPELPTSYPHNSITYTQSSTQIGINPKKVSTSQSENELNLKKINEKPTILPNVSSTIPKVKNLSSSPMYIPSREAVIKKSSHSKTNISSTSKTTSLQQATQKKSTDTLSLNLPLRDQAACFRHMPTGVGIQKLGPKKKKLSVLKKHILLERLDRWKQSQGLSVAINESSSASSNNNDNELDTVIVRLLNFIVDGDSILDEDEYKECVSDLLDLAIKIGPVKDVFIPQSTTQIEKGVFVLFHYAKDAKAAQACWNGFLLSGQYLSVSLLSKEALIHHGRVWGISHDTDWKDIVLGLDDSHLASTLLSDYNVKEKYLPPKEYVCDLSRITLLLNNILSEEDFEDEECLEESMSDIVEILEKYGSVIQDQTHIETSKENQGQVKLVLESTKDMMILALKELNSLILGGRQVSAQLANATMENNRSYDESTSNHPSKSNRTSTLILSNIFRDNDYEDEECFEETKGDIMRLVSTFGTIQLLDVKLLGDEKGEVHIKYLEGDVAINSAVNKLDGVTLGGYPIQARSLPDYGEPVVSNDKIIPEKYAECKRAPKIPFSDPRDYVMLRNDESVKSLLIEMLGELMRLQIRSQDDKNAKARRRLVMGFREVARGLRAHKIKMVILACNCDQYDAVDNKIQDILSLAKDQEVPIFFELNKRNIGKALGKTIKVSVVGVQNADGASAQFKSLKRISDEPIIT